MAFERVAIVGSRDYPDLAAVREYVRTLPRGTLVITGCSRGVDAQAWIAARTVDLEVDLYKADWECYGRAAGPIRNKQMVERCDLVVAFWDGESRGTASTIALARRAGKPVEIRRPRKL